MTPHRGGTILTLGILSLVVCPLLGFFAWFRGNEDLQQMNRGKMDSSGRNITNAGRICGMVAAGLFFIQLIFFAVLFALSLFNAR